MTTRSASRRRDPGTPPATPASRQEPAHKTVAAPVNAVPVRPPSESPAPARFPVVVIGASAGGLEAFKQFFTRMPAAPGMAFALIPHLDPSHKSLMVELLAKHTPMPVLEATHRMSIRVNHVYVIPPNKYLAIKQRHLLLSRPPASRGGQTAIDFAMHSLAEDQQEDAIGIVLSGTGSHGTAGLKDIKLAGGLIMVQDPTTAQFDQMPRHALAAGVMVDCVLAPEHMPEALIAYTQRMSGNRDGEIESPNTSTAEGLDVILALLLSRAKSDFRHYRRNMVLRRIQRRMALLRIEDIPKYIERLRVDLQELAALRRDLSIGVTAFFREAEAFNVLAAHVLPKLIRRASTDAPVRVWVPACSTGEEAYSLAILLFERFRAAGKEASLQIFGSDIDEESLKRARRGIYSDSAVAGISPERLRNFFIRIDAHHHQVSKPLREAVVFATQNLISDPPFSKLDLISCRNVLIYLEPRIQEKVISLLHFGLNENGYLLLGPAESIGSAVDLFEPISQKWRVYRRIGQVRRDLSIPIAAVRQGAPPAPTRASAAGTNEDLKSSNEEVMSMNEELQPANEELETSKEELQSLNEELSTVNSQLEEKVAELDTANNDLTNLMAATDIAILFLDPELRIKRFTAPAAKLLSLLPGDIGRPLRDFAPRLTDENLIPDSRRVLETMARVETEVRSAANRDYLRRILPYRGTDGPSGVVIVLIDVTERLQAEAQNRRLAAVLRDSRDAISVVDLTGRITAWNRGAETMYGYCEAEAVKLNLRDLATEAEREHALDFIERAARGEAVSSFETQRKAQDGRVLDVWATVTLLRDTAGNATSVATTERDMTARRRAEEQIRALNASLEQRVAERTQELTHSEDRVQAILDVTADAVVSIDTSGNIVTFNRSAERLFDYKAEQVVGKSVRLLIPQKDRGEHDVHLRGYDQSREPHIIGRPRELDARRRDGTIFPIRLSVTEVDHLGLFVGFIHDLTAAKALQEEVLNIATLEQQRVGQELHDGTQQELTGLGLLAQNLTDALRAEGSVANADLAARVASGIAEANLHVRSLARGLVPVPVGTDALPAALGELARTTAENYGLSCHFKYPKPIAVGNETTATHLYRIAQEAVANAVRHAKADTISIRLAQAHGNLAIEIRDNGVGIAPRTFPHSGVGLRIMEHRCSIIGGRFTVERQKGGGTLVACTIPGGGRTPT
jgi:two-component system CheB/CheR fusion protein